MAQHACTVCASRKVKCDRQQPRCGNCIKARVECRYVDPPPSQRHRKRRADDELLDRISHLERLLRQHGDQAGTWSRASGPLPYKGMELEGEEKAVAGDFEDAAVVGVSVSGLSVPSKQGATRPIAEPSRMRSPSRHHGDKQTTDVQSLFLRNPLSNVPRNRSNPDDSTSSWLLTPSTSDIAALHPPLRHILKLWQVFTENVNPLTKIVHAPTIQQRIMDTCWNLEQCTMPFHALLFAIYVLAVVSLSPDDCKAHFGETRPRLLKKYKGAAWQALLAACVFETSDLEVLQAFVLFLLASPTSETSTTLWAVAVRLGFKMGLDRIAPDLDPGFKTPKASFFDHEMRIRLWWQISTYDIAARRLCGGRETPSDTSSFRSARLPLNINDAELHPDMVRRPVEHVGATEMLYVLLKYEWTLWTQGQKTRSRALERKKDGNEDGVREPVLLSPGTLAARLDELETKLNSRYLRFCDPSIPLHLAARTLAGSLLCRPRFRIRRVMTALGSHDDGGSKSIDGDLLFDQAVKLLDLDVRSHRMTLTAFMGRDTAMARFDSVTYLLEELRQRGPAELGERRATEGWEKVSMFWDDQVGTVDLRDATSEDYAFYTALADLTLEVWQLRWQGLASKNGPTGIDDLTPQFMKMLQEVRPAKWKEITGQARADQTPIGQGLDVPAPIPPVVEGGYMDDVFWFGNDCPYDFECGNYDWQV